MRLNYAGNRACYDMKEDATQNVIFAIAQYSSKQLTKITDESGDRKAGYCAISGDCGETECTLAFISDMDLAGDSLEKGKVQVYTTKLIRENALGVPTFAPFTMITKASFDADSSSKAFATHAYTHDDSPPDTTLCPTNRSSAARMPQVEASGGVNLDHTGEHVVFRAKGSAFSPMASSRGPDAFLHTVADGSTFMINPTLVDCDLDAVQSFLVAQNPDAANLSPTTASCPSVAGQGGVPSAATIGVGATDNPVISGDARFMSYTANYDIADTRGALEAPQAITSPNLFLFDAKLGFTWQLTKEGDLPLKEADIEARGRSSAPVMGAGRGACQLLHRRPLPLLGALLPGRLFLEAARHLRGHRQRAQVFVLLAEAVRFRGAEPRHLCRRQLNRPHFGLRPRRRPAGHPEAARHVHLPHPHVDLHPRHLQHRRHVRHRLPLHQRRRLAGRLQVGLGPGPERGHL